MKKLNFNDHFKVTTKTTDYVNIWLINDLELFIDPYSIANNRSLKIVQKLYLRMKSFLETLNKTFVMPNDRKNGILFLSHLHEPNEYGFGYSENNKGKAISKTKADVIFTALSNNKFAKGGSTITNEAHNVLLLVKGIGQDNMSDVIANVCRDIFAEFTLDQCNIYGITTLATDVEFYDDGSKTWKIKKVQLPHYLGKHKILVPKFLAMNNRSYTSAYNWFVAGNHIAIDILNGKIKPNKLNSFMITLKDGRKKAIIKKINEHYKKPKDKLVDFVLTYNDSLDNFLVHVKNNFPDLTDEFLSEILK